MPKKTIKSTISLQKNLKALVTFNKTKHGDLGAYCGCSGAAVGSWLKGQSKPPIDKIGRICEFYSISLEDLVYKDIVIESKLKIIERVETIEKKRPKLPTSALLE
tara:strand:- start:1527 stop:1841 length:315 start_codon:yes stop_codon:yes gene_type:complete